MAYQGKESMGYHGKKGQWATRAKGMNGLSGQKESIGGQGNRSQRTVRAKGINGLLGQKESMGC